MKVSTAVSPLSLSILFITEILEVYFKLLTVLNADKFIGITRWDSARYPTLIQNTRFLIIIFEDNAAFRQRIAEIDVFINI